MAQDKKSKKSKSVEDFTTIKGIGQARQKWLVKVFDVQRFAELAALSVNDIEAALKAEKQSMVARSDIHDWLVQAKEFAAASKAPTDQAAKPAAKGKASAKKSAARHGTSSEWDPFASFVVEYRRRAIEGRDDAYQTSVHHIEGDQGDIWPGLEAEASGKWMLGLARGTLLSKPETAGRTEEPTLDVSLPAEAEIAIQVTGIHIRQPARAEPTAIDRSGQAVSRFIKSAEPFALDVAFEIVGSAASKIAKREIPYLSQLYAQDLSSGASLHLGNSAPRKLVEGQQTYLATLSRATLPRGAYRMQALVLVQSTPPIPGHHEGAIVQVL